MPITIIDFLSTNSTSIGKNSSNVLKKVGSTLVYVPWFTYKSLKNLLKILKGNSTIIEEELDYLDYCTALAGGIVNDVSNNEKFKLKKLLNIFKDLLPFEPTLTFSSKMTGEFLQIDAISSLICKYYKDEIPFGSDRIDILCISIIVVSRICKNNPKFAIALLSAIITLQIGSTSTGVTPSSIFVLLSAIRQLLEFENGLTFVGKFLED